MGSFSDCWGKHASGLSDLEKKSILDRTKTYKEEDGLSHDEALRKSLQFHHDEADAQLQSIHEQVFGKQEPVAQTGVVGTGEAPPHITELQTRADKTAADLEALGPEPYKPSPEKRYFGTLGREGAKPKDVQFYDEKTKAYNQWKRQYSKLQKQNLEASNELFNARRQETATGGYGPSASKSVLSTQDAMTQALDLVGKNEFDSLLNERLKRFGVEKGSAQEATHVENLARRIVSERGQPSNLQDREPVGQPASAIPSTLDEPAPESVASPIQSRPSEIVAQEPTSVSEVKSGTTASSIPKTGEVGAPKEEAPTISTKNAYTEVQRAVRGLPEAEQAAKRGFGKVWDEAAAQAEKDPTIGRRLVAEINAKPRPISDVENAHLLRREIEAQREHSDAIGAVNSAQTDSDLTAAKARLEVARNELQDVYDATNRAGTKLGQGLAARQMLANEDYSLAKMEARRRAANNGKPLEEHQLNEVTELYHKIDDLQSKLDAHEVAARFNNEFNKLVEQSRKEAKASKASGTRFTDFMDRKANEARSRIEQRRGRLTTGFDPTSITDEAVIGASHIAKGLTKFADWSVEMAREFGEQIRPFLKDIWEKAKAFHDANAKEYGDKALARYKTYLGKQTEQIKAKLEAGDFTKAQRQKTQLDKEAFNMRADLQKLKNQFERGVAKEAYQNKSPAQKFWDHFVGVERAMKLSGPEVFGKLGVAAAVREALAPIESGVGYGVSKAFPKLAKGTKYEADFGTLVRGELKAKAALFTEGMKDAWQNVKGQETGLDAIGKTKIRPDFWYNRIGQMHAAIKAPVKRAEFTRDLTQRMAVAIKNGEDINHPEVMTRLANESVMESNRAIFQNKTVVSNFFSMLERQSPAAGRVARFLFPVVKIPVNLFKELVNLHVGFPVGAARVGMAYWKSVETLPAIQREAIIRQLTKGSIGGAGLLWGYYNSDKVRNFFDHVPTWFNHTPMAMILNEGSYLKKIEQGGEQAKEGKKELTYMAKTDIPFMYTIKDIGDALDAHNSHALLGWINNMTQSTVVPQILTQTAKQMDKPGTFPSNLGEKPTYRPATNPLEAVKLGIPGLRQTVPVKEKKHTGVSRRR